MDLVSARNHFFTYVTGKARTAIDSVGVIRFRIIFNFHIFPEKVQSSAGSIEHEL